MPALPLVRLAGSMVDESAGSIAERENVAQKRAHGPDVLVQIGAPRGNRTFNLLIERH